MAGSSSGAAPRVVVVTRPTIYEGVLARHGTRQQARFFLETRGRSLDALIEQHQRFERALRATLNAIPVHWRRTRVTRADLSRFLFEPADTVVAVGQDGLVANVAKYLSGQLVVGINPARGHYDGVLVPHDPAEARDLIPAAVERKVTVESRTMVSVELDDGQRLLALNELFLGHRTHQSARYRIRWSESEERHSSSGVIVATGTGATGWARSIHRQRRCDLSLPAPEDRSLAFFVREAFPSVATGTSITEGRVGAGQALEIVSELDQGGVIFGDGIEDDHLAFGWGVAARVGVAPTALELVR